MSIRGTGVEEAYRNTRKRTMTKTMMVPMPIYMEISVASPILCEDA